MLIRLSHPHESATSHCASTCAFRPLSDTAIRLVFVDAPANRGGLYRPLSGEYFPRRLDSCCTSRTLALCWSRLPCLRPKALHRPSAKRHARKACVKLHPLGPPGLSSLTSSMRLSPGASEKSEPLTAASRSDHALSSSYDTGLSPLGAPTTPVRKAPALQEQNLG